MKTCLQGARQESFNPAAAVPTLWSVLTACLSGEGTECLVGAIT